MFVQPKTAMLLVGTALLIHPGFVMVAERKLLAEGEGYEINPLVVFEVMIGTLMSLWASIGEFKPIRVADAGKPRWESSFTRHDFRSFQTRSRYLYPLIEENIPKPPQA
eukprot:gnl/MRDRNA2_/MRDRNA2_124944_c0_seq1.p1 gnl/MRDRNA2_/MRDRNA2_124944_c0~~gnl/MRDRNA2_/MRDRNA2_124944_c0_seq1.p1  ORF type:complete len:109 (-),score=8.13 gnl/MRDRNA2_/MRDRNA2_124944_c0_seq1:42-368(-)